MKIKIPLFFIMSVFLLMGRPAWALEHTQHDGLFSMDIPEGWHWVEYPQEVIVTFSDGQTMAIDIQMAPSKKLSPADIKQILKQSNDKMIKEGIQAHNGTLIDDKEIKIDGVYATQLDFTTSPPHAVTVRYISFFNKDHAFTVTYGDTDPEMLSVMDDAAATLKFK